MNEWDIIARSFDKTRKYAWEECLDFISNIYGNAIDIGCGNGRHLLHMAKKCKLTVGIDKSFEMIKICKEKIEKERLKNVLLICSDACNLPFKSNFFDFAIFIATLHNIKGRLNRIKALKEMKRVLKKDGKALISVWAKWQDKWKLYFIKEFFKFWKEHGDIYIPWKELNVYRFYHLYSKREFKNDIKKSGLKIERIWSVKKVSKKSPDNHFAIVKK